MPNVSVIIPVYNTEEYLRKCLDSVCNQTLSNIEIICINDCSSDNSLGILKEYASKDTRIRIIDFEENKGAAAARNKGIDLAQGEYIGFIDSDDYVDLEFYEKLYNKAAETCADCAKGNYKSAANGSVDFLLNQKIREYSTNFVYAYCSAIFKRDVIVKNKIKFPLLTDMEDPVFTFNFALKMNKIVIVDDANINIVKRENSLTSGEPTVDKIKAKFTGLNMIIDIADKAQLTKESYAYILAFWVQQTFFNSIRIKDLTGKQFVVEQTIKLLDKIKYPELFYKELEQKNIVFQYYLKTKNKSQLLNFNNKISSTKSVFLKLRKNVCKEVENG